VGDSIDLAPGEPRDPKARVRKLVIALRVLLLAVSAGALAAAVAVSLGARSAGNSHVKYVCPMHPEVTSAEPGVCPICRMELEAVNVAAASAVRGSTYQSYDIARSRAYGPDTRAPAWVDQDGTVMVMLYADELAPRGNEQRGTFFPSSSSTGVEVRTTSEAPVQWDRSTFRVRFQVDSGAASLRPGEVGWLKLATRQREAPVIPSAAVIEGADGPYVLVASSNGRLLTRRPVQVGRVFGGMTAVLSGLKPSERVLIRGAFFLDAERRLRREATIEVAPR
jgi:hypothetical protein